MKKKLHFLLAFSTCALFINLCGFNTACAQALPKIATDKDKPVANNFAKLCLTKYKGRLFRNKTTAVGFDSRNLAAWLASVNDTSFTNTDTIRIYFGVYSSNAIKDVQPGGQEPDQEAYQHAKNKKNRFSVFLYPYHGNERAIYKPGTRSLNGKLQTRMAQDSIAPFNLGNVYP
jgi:hypothetical protein